jgi:uncharacterized membrane protein YeiH
VIRETDLVLLLILDLLGIAVFAVSGALVAVRRDLDVVGVLVLATVTGLGGGWIRDVLIGDTPPDSLEDWRYLLVPVGAGIATFFFHPALARMDRLVNVFDAFGLGLFAVAGALKAAEHGLGPVPAALLGMVTCIGGGLIRDVLTGRVPAVLMRSELYAVPATAGSAIAAAGFELDAPTTLVAVPAAVLTIGWRLLAIRRGWTAPVPRH